MFACLLCAAIGSWLLHYALHMTGYLQLCHAPEIACHPLRLLVNLSVLMANQQKSDCLSHVEDCKDTPLHVY